MMGCKVVKEMMENETLGGYAKIRHECRPLSLMLKLNALALLTSARAD